MKKFLVVLLFVTGCDTPTSPSINYQTDAVYTYLCNMWVERNTPVQDIVLADVSFRSSYRDLPREEDISFLKTKGARVVAQFSVPTVRVEIPVDSVPAVASAGKPAYMVRTVTSAKNFDTEVWVRFNKNVAPSDSAQLASTFVNLGGTVYNVWAYNLTGVIHNSRIQELRLYPEIVSIRELPRVCIASRVAQNQFSRTH